MTTPTVSEPVDTASGTPSYESLLAAVTDPDGREVPDPATGEVVGRVADRTADDVDAAVATARAVAARLQAGTVWINSHGGVHPMIPFGGVEQSGYGLEFGVGGLKAVAGPQVVNG
jgi:acyl-CoA reductase-like NAD-dependent aldehyde dehydrogenase